jgi:hypothetical protein
MIKPTVGRKVWFSPTEHGPGTKLGEQPFDATILYVHNDRLVNLLVVDHIGTSFPLTSVVLLQDGDAPAPEGGTVSWMPYQAGQAKVAMAQPTVNLSGLTQPVGYTLNAANDDSVAAAGKANG